MALASLIVQFSTAAISGVRYNYLNANDNCKGSALINYELKIIKKHTNTIYVNDLAYCNIGSILVNSFKNTKMNIFLGVYFDVEHEYYQNDINELLKITKHPGFKNVKGISVGFKLLSEKATDRADLIDKIKQVQLILRSDKSSQHVKVSTVDIISVYTQDIAEVVDYYHIIEHPTFQNENSSNFVSQIIKRAQKSYAWPTDYKKLIIETAWPTSGIFQDEYDETIFTRGSYLGSLSVLRDLHCLWKKYFDYVWAYAIDEVYQGDNEEEQANYGIFDTDLNIKIKQGAWVTCKSAKGIKDFNEVDNEVSPIIGI
ncbi:hypothetical protein BB561_005713 [Smittium simulii]|uniref:glucan endo-1,3-beta-D-glucosidase n=1 Tax=Smittium simulii TaxID=133385 RepID=A0A2T9Y8T5_9FUNG|nr:hypothetical protein BB561_005713 [Smittium simulii]